MGDNWNMENLIVLTPAWSSMKEPQKGSRQGSLLISKNAGKSRVSAFGCTKIYSWSRGFDQDLTNFWHSQKKISTG